MFSRAASWMFAGAVAACHVSITGAQPVCFDQRQVSTSDLPYTYVATGDLDGDGDQDAAAVSNNGDTVLWFENAGGSPPVFAEHSVSTAASGPNFVLLADLDNDTDLDIIVTMIIGDEVVWYENNGPVVPRFAPAQTIAGAFEQLKWVSVGHLNGDTWPDLVTTDQALGISIHISDGAADPSFTSSSVFSGDTPISIHIADMNGDLIPDLVGGEGNPNRLMWFENDGAAAPSFQDRTIISFGTGIAMVEVADVNGDGHIDVVDGSFGASSFAWYENDGLDPPTFTPNNVPNSAPTTRSVLAADIHSDGDLDLLVFGNSNQVFWYENNGTLNPGFTERSIDTSAGTIFHGVVADLDGDSDADICGNTPNDIIDLLAGQAVNLSTLDTFLALPAAIAPAMPGDQIVSSPSLFSCQADMLVIDKPIIVRSEFGIVRPIGSQTVLGMGSELEALDGDADFFGGLGVPASETATVQATTVRARGGIDIGAGAMFLADGELDLGAQPQLTQLPITAGFTNNADAALSDIDSDGDIDLFFGTFTSPSAVSWYENDLNNSGVFVPHPISSGVRATVLESLQISGDSNLDVLVLDDTLSAVTWYEHSGQSPPSFQQYVVHAEAIGSYTDVSPCDLNGDGDLDFASTYLGPSAREIRLHIGDGMDPPGFTTHSVPGKFSAGGPRSLECADLDGDGLPEIIVNDSGQYWVLWNNGGAVPVFGNVMLGGTIASGIERSPLVVDIDGDGLRDIVGVDYGANGALGYWRNGGGSPAVFSEIFIDTSSRFGRTFLAEDLDADGSLDVLVATDDAGLFWYESDGASPPSWTKRLVFGQLTNPSEILSADFDANGTEDVLLVETRELSLLQSTLATSFPVSAPGAQLTTTDDLDISNTELDIGDSAATVTAAGDVVLDNTARLTGGGTLGALTLRNAGTTSVTGGNTLNISGGYTQRADVGALGTIPGTLEIELPSSTPGTQSVLDVSGTLDLDGTLRITAPPSFDPVVGDKFEVLVTPAPTAGTTAFNVAFLPGLDGDRFLRIVYDDSGALLGPGGNVTVIVDSLSGPLDLDGANTYAVGGTPSGATLADIGAWDDIGGQAIGPDGLLDLVVTIPDDIDPINNAGSVVVLFNQLTVGASWPGFSAGTAVVPVGPNPTDVSSADFDLANGADLVVSNAGNSSYEILLNDGNGTLTSQGAQTLSGFNDEPQAILAVDLDGLNAPDFVIAGSAPGSAPTDPGVVTPVISTGPGTFAVGTNTTVGVNPRDLVFGELDGDKWEDIVVANAGSNSISVLDNLGAAGTWLGFAAPVSYGVGDAPVWLSIADMDGDKWEDIVVADRNSDSMTVALNDQSGTFLPQPALPVGDEPRSIVAVDLDADTDPDVALVLRDAQGDRVVRVFRNDLSGGQLAFAPTPTDQLSGQNPIFVLAGDVDGLNSDDLVAVNDSTGAGASPFSRGGAAEDVAILQSGITPACEGDADGNNLVDVADIAYVIFRLGNSGTPGTVDGDADGNGTVDVGDISYVIFRLGNPC